MHIRLNLRALEIKNSWRPSIWVWIEFKVMGNTFLTLVAFSTVILDITNISQDSGEGKPAYYPWNSGPNTYKI